MEDLLSAQDAAKLLGVSRARVLQLIRQGVIPVQGRVGQRTYVLRRTDVERLARDGWPGRRPPT